MTYTRDYKNAQRTMGIVLEARRARAHHQTHAIRLVPPPQLTHSWAAMAHAIKHQPGSDCVVSVTTKAEGHAIGVDGHSGEFSLIQNNTTCALKPLPDLLGAGTTTDRR